MNLNSIRDKKQKINLEEKTSVNNQKLKFQKNNLKLIKQESKISNLIKDSLNYVKTSYINSPIKIQQNSIQLNNFSIMSPNKESNIQWNNVENKIKLETKKSSTTPWTSQFSKKVN